MPNEDAALGPLRREFEPLLNLEEAAAVLGMHWKTLERMARGRKVPALKVGKTLEIQAQCAEQMA